MSVTVEAANYAENDWSFGHIAALTRSHLIGDHPSGLTKEQTTETMDPSPKTKRLRPHPHQWNLVLVGAARLPVVYMSFTINVQNFDILMWFTSYNKNKRKKFYKTFRWLHVIIFKWKENKIDNLIYAVQGDKATQDVWAKTTYN